MTGRRDASSLERSEPGGEVDEPAAAHDPVHARVGVRTDQQLHRHRRRAPQAGAPGRLRGRGLVEGAAGPTRVRGGARRAVAAGGGRGTGRWGAGRRPVLEGLHPRDRARVPQAHDRAARDVHQADLPGAHRRCRLLPAEAEADRRRGAAGRRRRGQRRQFPRAAHWRRAIRADHVLQPAGGARAAGPADVLRTGLRRQQRVGRVRQGARADASSPVGVLQRVGPGAGRPCAAGPRLRAHLGAPQPLRVPRGRGLHPGDGPHLESSVRATEAELALPDVVTDRPEASALVYLSLGSLGSADVELMKRLVDVLSRTPHHYIVSTGPCHREYELAGNMWGQEFLPQTKILPLVDLVLTHGGNNTTVEALHFGKPMVVLPLFWDQYDNAQRMAETGFGVRLDTYAFTEEQMRSAIDRLLGDEPLRARLAQVSAQIRSQDGVTRAADLIEALAAG